jgi:predicted metal-dependent enzyme (double-stranded beta helix superfamily)
MTLTELVQDARRATTAPDPIAALRRLQELVADSAGDVLSWLPGGGSDEQVLHAEPAPTLLRVEIPPRTEYPPHDHLIPACVAVLHGRETNTFYRAEGPAVIPVAEIETAAGGVLPMDEHVIHTVGNRTAGRSIALHLYLSWVICSNCHARSGTCGPTPARPTPTSGTSRSPTSPSRSDRPQWTPPVLLDRRPHAPRSGRRRVAGATPRRRSRKADTRTVANPVGRSPNSRLWTTVFHSRAQDFRRNR